MVISTIYHGTSY